MNINYSNECIKIELNRWTSYPFQFIIYNQHTIRLQYEISLDKATINDYFIAFQSSEYLQKYILKKFKFSR